MADVLDAPASCPCNCWSQVPEVESEATAGRRSPTPPLLSRCPAWCHPRARRGAGSTAGAAAGAGGRRPGPTVPGLAGGSGVRPC